MKDKLKIKTRITSLEVWGGMVDSILPIKTEHVIIPDNHLHGQAKRAPSVARFSYVSK